MQYFFGAYTILWVIILSYLFNIGRRQSALEKQLDTLLLVVEKKEN